MVIVDEGHSEGFIIVGCKLVKRYSDISTSKCNFIKVTGSNSCGGDSGRWYKGSKRHGEGFKIVGRMVKTTMTSTWGHNFTILIRNDNVATLLKPWFVFGSKRLFFRSSSDVISSCNDCPLNAFVDLSNIFKCSVKSVSYPASASNRTARLINNIRVMMKSYIMERVLDFKHEKKLQAYKNQNETIYFRRLWIKFQFDLISKKYNKAHMR